MTRKKIQFVSANCILIKRMRTNDMKFQRCLDFFCLECKMAHFSCITSGHCFCFNSTIKYYPLKNKYYLFPFFAISQWKMRFIFNKCCWNDLILYRIIFEILKKKNCAENVPLKMFKNWFIYVAVNKKCWLTLFIIHLIADWQFEELLSVSSSACIEAFCIA